MNEKKRTELRYGKSLLEKALIIVTKIKDMEQDSLSNMPENLQESERYIAMEEAIEELESAIENIELAIENIDNAC